MIDKLRDSNPENFYDNIKRDLVKFSTSYEIASLYDKMLLEYEIISELRTNFPNITNLEESSYDLILANENISYILEMLEAYFWNEYIAKLVSWKEKNLLGFRLVILTKNWISKIWELSLLSK